MKLDQSIVDKLMLQMYDILEPGWTRSGSQIIRERLQSLDLVIKPGDSNQETLVENNPK